MTEKTKRTIEFFLALAIPLFALALATGVTLQKVDTVEATAGDNTDRLRMIEVRQSMYKQDVQWIKETLTEIKTELRAR